MTLDLYVARRYLTAFIATALAFFAILALVDLVEQLRRYAGEAEGVWPIVALTLLNVPAALYTILPLITILAAIALFLAMGRSSELIVARAAGRSAIRTLLGPALVALALGALAVAAFNPIVAATSREYEARAGDLDGSGFGLADDALWFRQGGAEGQTVIRAQRSNLDGTILSGVTFLAFGADGRPFQRTEARTARLTDAGWELSDVTAWPLDAPNPQAEARRAERLIVPTTLTPDRIRDSFGAPSSIPIWELPRFIERLEEAGFSAQRHRVFLQMELALPAFLLAMLLVSAAFTLRPQRGRRMGIMALAAVLTGFASYALRTFAQILGDNGQIPPALAGWAPPLVVTGLALGLLLHLEEG